MREIKFRAWTGVEYIYEGWNVDVFITKKKIFDYDLVEQFTGLKDKNGVDIYEGDILKTFSIDEGELIEHVIFCDGCFKLTSPSKLDWPIFDYKCDYIELIGNVHDNPDLL